MDDFILLTQGPIKQQQQVCQILLEYLDSVIRPLDHTDQKEQKEAASAKNFLMMIDVKWLSKLSWDDC